MKTRFGAALILALATTLPAEALDRGMRQYRPQSGLTAIVQRNVLVLTWSGAQEIHLRASFAIEDGLSLIRELAVQKEESAWNSAGNGAFTQPIHLTTSSIK